MTLFGRPTRRQKVIVQAAATALVIPFAIPLVALVAISFTGEGALANYTAVLTETPFLQFLVNTTVLSVLTVIVVYVCTILGAYAFSKMRFPGRHALYGAVLLGLVLPIIALAVPIFAGVARFGLFNNIFAVVVPLAAVLVPFTLLLTRNYLDGVPDEILEAARIDGASSFRVLLSIVMPLAKPITVVVVVWAFLNTWNEFFLPLLIMQDQASQMITQVPIYFTSTYGSDIPKIFAALVLISLPIVVAYLSLQKFFEKGLSAGAIK